MKKIKETPKIKLVFDCLVQADDLLTTREIVTRTQLPLHNVSTSLRCLRLYHAVDCIEGEDQLWWFAQPEEDLRVRVVEERTPESKPRRPKRPRKRKGPVIPIYTDDAFSV